MEINAPKGTKDLLASQSYKWQYVEREFAKICDKYGFRELRTPIFEHTELFTRGIGDTTDVVQKEMYTFKDYAGRSITLKPEGTSPAVRSFVEHKQYAETQPTKYYYNSPCFRYEKPQSGRLREFHQFGIEVFGTPNMLADAEVISLAYDFLNTLGIKDIELRINSVGCPTCREKHRKAFREFLLPKYDKLCGTCKDRFERNPMRIIDCKSEVCKEVIKGAPMMIDYLCEECSVALEELKQNLASLEIPYTLDPTIVRGLDYYTKTAFEFVTEKIGAQGTVCGGGRYDHLIEEVGGPPIPGVGFGMGIERLIMLMEANEVDFEQPNQLEVFVAILGDSPKTLGLSILKELRSKGIKSEMDTLSRNIKGQFKYADRLGAKYTIVVGENEVEKGEVTIKNMKTSEQKTVKIDDIIKEITTEK